MSESPLLRVLLSAILIGLVLSAVGCLGRGEKQSGVFASTDHGQTWQAMPDLLAKNKKKSKFYPPQKVNAVAASPQDPNFVIAGSTDDLYRSTDGGAKWEKLTPRIPSAKKAIDVQSIRFDAAHPGTFYVSGVSGGYGKIYKSTDRGENIRDVFTLSQPAQTVTCVTVIPGTDTVLAGDQLGNIYRSRDGGTSWRRVVTLNQIVTTLLPRAGAVYAATSGAGIYRSTDGGVTFTPVNSGLTERRVNVWGLANGPGGLYAATDGGLLLSQGGAWRAVPTPVVPAHQRVQAVAADRTYVYFAANAVVYQLTPGNYNAVAVQLKTAKQIYALVSPADGTVFAGVNNESNDFSDRYGSGLPGFRLKPLGA